MSDTNPYDAPVANVADTFGADEVQSVKIFSPNGRMGRVRYIGYSMGLMLVAGLAAALLAGMLQPVPSRRTAFRCSAASASGSQPCSISRPS